MTKITEAAQQTSIQPENLRDYDKEIRQKIFSQKSTALQEKIKLTKDKIENSTEKEVKDKLKTELDELEKNHKTLTEKYNEQPANKDKIHKSVLDLTQHEVSDTADKPSIFNIANTEEFKVVVPPGKTVFLKFNVYEPSEKKYIDKLVTVHGTAAKTPEPRLVSFGFTRDGQLLLKENKADGSKSYTEINRLGEENKSDAGVRYCDFSIDFDNKEKLNRFTKIIPNRDDVKLNQKDQDRKTKYEFYKKTKEQQKLFKILEDQKHNRAENKLFAEINVDSRESNFNPEKNQITQTNKPPETKPEEKSASTNKPSLISIIKEKLAVKNKQ